MKAIRGQAQAATILIGSFIVIVVFAIIALALTPSLATGAMNSIAGGNTSASNAAGMPGVVPIVSLITTIWAIIIILVLISAMGLGFVLLRK